MKRIQIEQNILQHNVDTAFRIRQSLDQAGILALNIMASPGAGKTSVILETILALKTELPITVIEGDVVDIDVKKIRALQIPVALANTGGACHLDAWMMEKALQNLKIPDNSLLIVENVGNLICPANFDIGTHRNIVIASVPEGDDKPLKYPGMFRGADMVLLNKMDYRKHTEFDLHKFTTAIQTINPDVQIMLVSCRDKSGIPSWIDWIRRQARRQIKH